MKVVTLLNEKGGVGKTSLAIQIASGLAIRGKRVLVVDTDPQGHATVGLGHKKAPNLYQLLIYPEDNSFDDMLRLVPPSIYAPGEMSKGELYLLPTDLSARVIPQMTSDSQIIRNTFSQLEGHMDVIIFDTSPTPSLLHGSIYMATDSVIYPTECSFFSFDGLKASIGRRKEINSARSAEGLNEMKVAGIIPTKLRTHNDGFVKAHETALNQLKEMFGDAVWPGTTLMTVWEQAQQMRKTLFAFDPEGPATKQAWDIVSRVEDMLEKAVV